MGFIRDRKRASCGILIRNLAEIMIRLTSTRKIGNFHTGWQIRQDERETVADRDSEGDIERAREITTSDIRGNIGGKTSSTYDRSRGNDQHRLTFRMVSAHLVVPLLSL